MATRSSRRAFVGPPAPVKPSPITPSKMAGVRVSLVPRTSDKVAQPSATYERGKERRALCRALMGGTKAMREAGETYLPRHPAETVASYRARLESTVLFNGFSDTTVQQAGKFFGEPLVLKSEGDGAVPPPLVEYSENIDGQGRAISPFCFDLCKEAFVDGVSFLFVDFPNVRAAANKQSSLATMADQQRIGARPYWIILTADQVIGWRSQNVYGRQVLTQIRILETTVEDEGDFGEKMIERIRVLEPGSWAIWEKRRVSEVSSDSVWTEVDAGVSSLDYIPVIPFYTNRKGFFDGSPPLRTLAEMNQEHWISSSEQRRALTFGRFPMLKIIGADGAGTTVETGPDKIIVCPKGGDAGIIETSGGALGAGRQDLIDIETRMQHAGMELRIENAGTISATAAAIDSDETNATLRAIAKELESVIESALQFSADYLNLQSGGQVEVSDAFAGNEIPGTIADLTSLRTSGSMSLPTLWTELKRRHILSEDFDMEKELLLLTDEAAYFAGLQAEQGNQGTNAGGGASSTPPPDQGGAE